MYDGVHCIQPERVISASPTHLHHLRVSPAQPAGFFVPCKNPVVGVGRAVTVPRARVELVIPDVLAKMTGVC